MRSHEICALLGYYAAYNGKSVPTFRDNLLVPLIDPISEGQEGQDFLILEDRSDRLSRKVDTELPPYFA
jgi:hypothetical protein